MFEIKEKFITKFRLNESRLSKLPADKLSKIKKEYEVSIEENKNKLLNEINKSRDYRNQKEIDKLKSKISFSEKALKLINKHQPIKFKDTRKIKIVDKVIFKIKDVRDDLKERMVSGISFSGLNDYTETKQVQKEQDIIDGKEPKRFFKNLFSKNLNKSKFNMDDIDVNINVVDYSNKLSNFNKEETDAYNKGIEDGKVALEDAKNFKYGKKPNRYTADEHLYKIYLDAYNRSYDSHYKGISVNFVENQEKEISNEDNFENKKIPTLEQLIELYTSTKESIVNLEYELNKEDKYNFDNFNLSDEIKQAINDVESKDSFVESLENEIAKLIKYNNQLKNEKSLINNNVDNKAALIQELEDNRKIKLKTNELNDIMGTPLVKFNPNIIDVESLSNEEINLNLEKLIKENDELFEIAEEKAKELITKEEKELNELIKDINGLETKLNKTNSEFSVLNAIPEDAALEFLEQRLAELKNQKDTLMSTKYDLETEVKLFGNKKDEAIEQEEPLSDQLDPKDAEIARLKEELEAIKLENQNLKTDVQSFGNNLNGLFTNMENFKQVMDEIVAKSNINFEQGKTDGKNYLKNKIIPNQNQSFDLNSDSYNGGFKSIVGNSYQEIKTQADKEFERKIQSETIRSFRQNNFASEKEINQIKEEEKIKQELIEQEKKQKENMARHDMINFFRQEDDFEQEFEEKSRKM